MKKVKIDGVEYVVKSESGRELVLEKVVDEVLLESQIQALRQPLVSGLLPLETKLEMFYDFLYERGIANQLGVGIDTVVKHFIDEKLSGNFR